jgi:hypothetical protein
LNRHPAVAASAVVARGQACSKSLVAYVVPRESSAPSASSLREFLAASLPHYMVPSAFVQISALPSNSNGKLDRGALPDPDAKNRIEDAGYRAPSTPTEEQLVQILSRLLGVERVEPTIIFSCSGFTPCLQLRLPHEYTSVSVFNSVFATCSRPKLWRAWRPKWIAN